MRDSTASRAITRWCRQPQPSCHSPGTSQRDLWALCFSRLRASRCLGGNKAGGVLGTALLRDRERWARRRQDGASVGAPWQAGAQTVWWWRRPRCTSRPSGSQEIDALQRWQLLNITCTLRAGMVQWGGGSIHGLAQSRPGGNARSNPTLQEGHSKLGTALGPRQPGSRCEGSQHAQTPKSRTRLPAHSHRNVMAKGGQ